MMSDTGRRAAIVLFVEVHDESADTRDAAHRAEAGLKAALAGDAQLGYGHQKWHVSVKGNESKHVPCDVRKPYCPRRDGSRHGCGQRLPLDGTNQQSLPP